MSKFNIIYADPPWAYKDKRDKHKRLCGGALSHYDTLSLSELKELPINQISEDNCMLFLWATFPNLREAIELMESWGFKYKTQAFTWIKTNKKNGQPFFGIGYYTKSNAEVCLLGVKGKPIKVSNSVSSVIISPREGHSKKPDIVRNKIVQLCGDIPRIELFSRNSYEGWTTVGNEIDGMNIKESLNNLININE